MKRLWMSAAAMAMAASLATVSAQTPPQQPPAPAAAQNEATTTLQGCVYNEKDVPGRTPNVAEKAGVMEDYILVTSAASPAPAGTTGTTPPATAGTMGGSFKAYKLEQIADERLKAVVGKRVEVTGRVDKGSSATAAGTTADKNPASPDKIELPEFEVTSLREVEGTCPAVPEIKK